VADAFTIDTIDLRKQYDEGIEALRGLTLQVPRGCICGFLGRNGAGKTTTIKILLDMARPTSGHARVFGLSTTDPASSVDIRRRVGFVSDDKDLYGALTVDEMTRFTASFFPKWRAELERHYMQLFDLPRDRKVKALSRGMRTKLALLLALCRGAELLVLDEPTSGLDPAAAEEVLQAIVGHVAREELTVFFASHQIAEVEQIADRIAIINRGRIVVSGALDDIRDAYRRIQLVFDADAPDAVFRTAGVERIERNGRILTVFSSGGAEPIVEEARALRPLSVDVCHVTLKEIFLESVASED